MDTNHKRHETLEVILTAVMVWFGLASFALIFQVSILWDSVVWSPVPIALWALIKVARLRKAKD